MDKDTRQAFALLLAFWIPLIPSVQLHAAPYVDPANEFVVADTTAYERLPRVSGSRVTWSSRPGPGIGHLDVYYRTLPGGSPVNITNDPAHDQYYSDIAGNIIVYDDVITGVMAHTIGSSTADVCDTGSLPRISENLVVWEDSRDPATRRDIYGKELPSGSVFSICTNSSQQNKVAVSGDIVVWRDMRNLGTTGDDIYGYNLSAEQEFYVCKKAGTQDYPDVWGDIVVWQDYRDAGTNYWDIYGYNLGTQTEFPIAVGPLNQRWPAISGDYVVWKDGSVIRCYSISSEDVFDVTESSGADEVAIDGDIIVWRDWRGPNAPDIYGNRILSAIVMQEKKFGSDPLAASASDPVNTATGNFYLHETDLTVAGPGIDLEFIRAYNSQDSYPGAFGPGWTHSYNVFVTPDPCSEMVLVKWGDGQGHYYLPDSGDPDSYHPAIGAVYDNLKKNPGNTWTVTRKNQTLYNFDTVGKLTAIADKNGNTVALSYDVNGLDQITDTVGRIIDIVCDYNGLVQSLTDPNNRQIIYGYTGGKLSSVTDAQGNTEYYTYDPCNGMLKTITDRRGIVDVNNIYDPNSRVIQQVNGRGRISSFSYNDPNENQTTIMDPLGRQTIHTYDSYLRLVSITDPCVKTISYTYDSKSNRTSITDKNGFTRYFTYDEMGNALTMTDPNDSNDPNTGAVTTVTYDPNTNNPLTKTEATGTPVERTWTCEYDPNGNLTRTVDANGYEWLRTYTSNGLLATETDANGHTTRYTYDANGNLTDVNDALGNITHYTYDEIGRMVKKQDARGNETTYGYGRNDNLLRETDANGKTVSYSYDENSNKTSFTNRRGNTWQYEYNENDIRYREVDPCGFDIEHGYDDVDNCISVTDKRGKATRYTYDALNRLIDVNDPLGNHTRYAYDAKGNRVSMTNGLGKTWTYQYDALDRLAEVNDPLGNITGYEYDLLGRKVAVTDARGNKTQYEYDVLDRLVKVDDAIGGVTQYEYDPVDNLTAFVGANNKRRARQYDALNRLVSESDPLGNATQYRYDEVGNPNERTDAMGRRTTYEYDDLNRLIDVNYPDGTQVSYSHDENGNLISMTDWNGQSSYEYDELNRMTASTDAFSNRVEYEYDPAGNRKAITYPDGNDVKCTYDDAGRLAEVNDWNGRVTTYVYDAAYNLKSFALPNSCIQSYDYDDASRLISVENKDVDGNSIGSFQYTLDEVGNRIEVNEVGTLPPTIPYSDQNYAYDDADQLSTGGNCTYSFNDNGDQISRDCIGWITEYSYDAQDRLTGVNEPGLNVEHTVDGRGNRIARTVNGQEKRYVLDLASPMSQVLCQTDPNGNITAHYIYGAGLLAKIAAEGNERFYHYDGLGSTTALTDANGLLTDRYAYTPFGEVANSEGSTENSFKYVGRFGVMTEPDGTLFMRARFYDPATGRFLSKDPVQGSFNNPLSLHDYLYVSSNPMSNIDPEGTVVITLTLILIGAYILGSGAAEVILSPDVEPVQAFAAGALGGAASVGVVAAATYVGQPWAGLAAAPYVRSGVAQVVKSLSPTPSASSEPPSLANIDVHATTPYQPPDEQLTVDLNTSVTMPEGYPYTHMDLPWTVPALPSEDFRVDLGTNTPDISSVNPDTYTPTHTSTTRKY